MIEKTIESEIIYKGKALNLRVDTIEGPAGTGKREIIEHSQAVTIIPFQEPDTIYFIRQFRKATEQVLIEFPAGCIEDGEAPEKAALRELKEETGLIADQCQKLVEMYMAPGFCDEYMHVYIVQGLTMGETNMDEDECIDVVTYSLAQAKSMIKAQKIIDAKTITGVYLLDEFIREGTNII